MGYYIDSHSCEIYVKKSPIEKSKEELQQMIWDSVKDSLQKHKADEVRVKSYIKDVVDYIYKEPMIIIIEECWVRTDYEDYEERYIEVNSYFSEDNWSFGYQVLQELKSVLNQLNAFKLVYYY